MQVQHEVNTMTCQQDHNLTCNARCALPEQTSAHRRAKLCFGTNWESIKDVGASWHLESCVNLRQMKGGFPSEDVSDSTTCPSPVRQTDAAEWAAIGRAVREAKVWVCWLEWTGAARLGRGEWRLGEDRRTPSTRFCTSRIWFYRYNVWCPMVLT